MVFCAHPADSLHASAEQRKGRAGRVQQGKCIRLWRESENTAFEKYHLAEILNADLTDMLVQLAKWGSPHFDDIDWITQPENLSKAWDVVSKAASEGGRAAFPSNVMGGHRGGAQVPDKTMTRNKLK